MKRILLSCLGTTDPVRGEHDGPMLHILRHYRPDGAWLFLSAEVEALAQRDARFEKAEAWVNEHWGGYHPVFHYERSGIAAVHDIDALEKPLYDMAARLSRENPDAEILVNLSSGTPQMQMILSQIAMDMRFHATGIQVGNFEKAAGKAERTNRKTYDVDLELECNEDELPDAENRCTEPQMFALRREYTRRQIVTLLDNRDFSAVEALSETLPENLRLLAMHLAARSRLQKKAASQLAKQVHGLPFPLYSYKEGSREDYSAASEYYLLMKNLVQAGSAAEFVLHLEPLTLTLQIAMLDVLLKPYGCRTVDFTYPDRRGVRKFSPDYLRNKLPVLHEHYVRCMATRNWEEKDAELSTVLLDELLAFFPNLPAQPRQLFAHYAALKELRNRLAHRLVSVTMEEIEDACGVRVDLLLREIEGTLMACYPACDPAVFSVYDKSIAYIKEHL